MKRRVIQLAGKTAVISLPSKWVKQYSVKKGDELEIEELGNQLLIKTSSSQTEIKKISINIENLNERTLRLIMSALHKLGYDEITLFFESNKLSNTIQDLIKNLLLGFVVIDQTNKKCVLKSVSNDLDTEFDSTLRRAFLVSLSLANSSLEVISSKDFTSLPSLINLERSNNQLTSFCLRLMNKGFYKEKEKKLFLSTIIWDLEKIADEYKEICLALAENKIGLNIKILKLYKEVNALFNSYYELIYKFSLEKLDDLANKKKEIVEKAILINPQTKNEIKVISNLLNISSKLSDMSSSIVALNYEKLV